MKYIADFIRALELFSGFLFWLNLLMIALCLDGNGPWFIRKHTLSALVYITQLTRNAFNLQLIYLYIVFTFFFASWTIRRKLVTWSVIYKMSLIYICYFNTTYSPVYQQNDFMVIVVLKHIHLQCDIMNIKSFYEILKYFFQIAATPLMVNFSINMI